ncbi:MAG: hypothetical protein U5P10_07200 [Spirochaetia bacterium]|nr:hypothetical protein [Spirochaetia bacterium]
MAFLSAKEIKIYGLVVAGVTLLALIGTLVFLVLSREPDSEPPKAPDAATDSSAGADLLGKSLSSESALQKIRIPEEYTQLYQQDWHPYRKRHSSWSEEQVEAFWQDPQKLIQEVLQKASDREIEEFFKEIP